MTSSTARKVKRTIVSPEAKYVKAAANGRKAADKWAMMVTWRIAAHEDLLTTHVEHGWKFHEVRLQGVSKDGFYKDIWVDYLSGFGTITKYKFSGDMNDPQGKLILDGNDSYVPTYISAFKNANKPHAQLEFAASRDEQHWYPKG